MLASVTFSYAEPAIPGLNTNHPLSDEQVGMLLIEELRCAACHDGIGDSKAPSAPNLKISSAFLSQDYLGRFLSNPAEHDPGTTMPSLMGAIPEDQRDETVDALIAYLSSQTASVKKPDKSGDPKEGKKLFHEVGCVACHGPMGSSEGGTGIHNPFGGHVSEKYHSHGLAAFLSDPLSARPSGRMPNMRLNADEAAHLTAYLLGDKAEAKPAKQSSPDKVNKGRKVFHELRCASCHNVDDNEFSSPAAPARDQFRLDKGCLSENPESAPDYDLSDQQRAAIRKALSRENKPLSADDQVKMHLTQLNCISCHERDEYGGVPQSLDIYFHSTEEALGDASRIPPPLTQAGAKLKPLWMNKVLYDGERVRPYMTTRMPLFGQEALNGLGDKLSEADKMEPFDYAPLEKESRPMMMDGAHMLLGNKGLSCISCHNFNGKDSPSMKGLDLMTTYQRLQPAWYDSFMRNPAKHRPGIIMPSFWPGGEAVQTEILDGNTDDQLRALWHYFSLGRSARDPSGLIAEDNKLIVTDKTRVYRGRSRVAGFRGIAVGHPGGLNYAFNAQNGAISAIWTGEFVKVAWHGQGAGDFNPLNKVTELPGDIAFLSELPDVWPLTPVRTKEKPINPDPLYPRQHGYAFKGYSLNSGGIPSLRYNIGNVAISDFSLPAKGRPHVLYRRLNFDTKEKTTLFFRPLTGDLKKTSINTYQTDDIKIEIKDMQSISKTIIRPATKGKELIVELNLEPGTSELTLYYELQK